MKKHHLVITEEADFEIISTYKWYEDKLEELGERFLLELDNSFNQIDRNPKSFQIIYKKHRQAILKKFPFVVIYQQIKNEIIIFAVFHTSQDPKKKRR